MKKFTLAALMLLSFFKVFAQQGSDVEMADKLRGSGMFYVVITTIVIVFIALAIYLFMMDSRLRKIEREEKQRRG